MRSTKTRIILPIVFCLFLIACNTEKEIFSDSFEKLNLENSEFWSQSGNGSIQIDTEKAYSGSQSLKFNTGEGFSNRAFLNLEHLFPIKDNSFGGSYMLFIEEVSPDGIHWTMVEASGQLSDHDSRADVRYGGQKNQRLMANYDTPSKTVNTDCWQHSQTVLPNQKWVEIAWYFDGKNEAMHFWLDGKKLDDITMVKKGEGCLENDLNGQWIFPTFDRVTIGWVDYQKNGGNRKLWIDDLVVYSESPYSLN